MIDGLSRSIEIVVLWTGVNWYTPKNRWLIGKDMVSMDCLIFCFIQWCCSQTHWSEYERRCIHHTLSRPQISALCSLAALVFFPTISPTQFLCSLFPLANVQSCALTQPHTHSLIFLFCHIWHFVFVFKWPCTFTPFFANTHFALSMHSAYYIHAKCLCCTISLCAFFP